MSLVEETIIRPGKEILTAILLPYDAIMPPIISFGGTGFGAWVMFAWLRPFFFRLLASVVESINQSVNPSINRE